MSLSQIFLGLGKCKLLFRGIVFFFLFFSVIIVFISCENDINEVNRIAGVTAGGMEIGKDLIILYSDSAKLKVKITTPEIIRLLDPSDRIDRFPKGIKIEFFDDSGNVTSTLTAKTAERSLNKKEVACRDSVFLINDKNETMLTNELIWDEQTKMVETEKFVRLTRPGEIIYSFGFKADQNFSKFELKAISGKLNRDNIQNQLN